MYDKNISIQVYECTYVNIHDMNTYFMICTYTYIWQEHSKLVMINYWQIMIYICMYTCIYMYTYIYIYICKCICI
jgi:hypothetical protein